MSRDRINREKYSRVFGTRAVGISRNNESRIWDDAKKFIHLLQTSQLLLNAKHKRNINLNRNQITLYFIFD
jgi:hypothetical protein